MIKVFIGMDWELVNFASLLEYYKPNSSKSVRYEAPESDKHPSKLDGFVKKMRSGKVNYIITTNSPVLLDHFNYDEILIVQKHKLYVLELKRFMDHPSFSSVCDSLNPGEFWNAYGDEW